MLLVLLGYLAYTAACPTVDRALQTPGALNYIRVLIESPTQGRVKFNYKNTNSIMNSIMNSCNPTTTESFLLQKIYRSTYDFSPIKLADDRWWAGVILPTSRLLRRSFFPLIPSSIIHFIHPSSSIIANSRVELNTHEGCDRFRMLHRSPPRRNATSFAVHLYEMMSNPVLAPLCGFSPDGKSFYVTNSKEFPEKVLPQVQSCSFWS